MAKYAKKYAAIRKALLGKEAEPSPVIVEVEPIIEQPKAKSASGKKKAAPKKSAPSKKKE